GFTCSKYIVLRVILVSVADYQYAFPFNAAISKLYVCADKLFDLRTPIFAFFTITAHFHAHVEYLTFFLFIGRTTIFAVSKSNAVHLISHLARQLNRPAQPLAQFGVF